MGAINPGSAPWMHPQFGKHMMQQAKVIAVPLEFLFAKFTDFWPSSNNIPDFDHTIKSDIPDFPPGVPDKINDIALSPDSPLNPGIEVPVPKNPTATDNLFGALTSAVTKIKGLWPLIPPFLYALINSKEIHLQNINVEITATTKKKIYQIEFGKFNGEGVSLAIEVVAGRPIQFLHDKNLAGRIDNFINPIFPTTSIFSRIWKRQEWHTECIIKVNDPGNYLLKNKQVMQFFPLSDNEGFKIIQKDPTIIKNPFGPDYTEYDYYEDAENSEYSSFSHMTVKLEEPMAPWENKRTDLFPLPFGDENKPQDYYLEITQYQ